MVKFCFRSRLLLSCLLMSFCVLQFAATDSSAEEFGLDGRIGHTALPTVGRNTGITYLEMFPYIQTGEEQILFGDIRGFVTNEGNLGTNITTGYRFLEPGNLFVLGVNGSFDFDQTSGKTFQQVGFGFEGLTSVGNITTNFYFPVGRDEKIVEQTQGNIRFQGTQLVMDTLDIIGTAMNGVDVAMGVYLPGEFAQEHQMEATFGWYHFEGGSGPNIDGYQIRIDGHISDALSALTSVTNDDTFGTNVTIGFDWRFGAEGLPDSRLEKQLRRFVRRNYNVILSERGELGIGVPVNSPVTGLAYNVQHISNGIATILPFPAPPAFVPDGSVDSPWGTIADAQAAGADLLVLHSGTSLSENIALTDGQILLGEGTPFQLESTNFGTIDLPTINPNPGNIPVVLPQLTPTGNGLVLGNNSRISGVIIDSPAGIGILADGVTGFSVENVSINSSAGNAIEIRNASQGSFKDITINGGAQDGIYISDANDVLTFEDIFVSNVVGNAVNIFGGYGTVDFNGGLTLDNNLGGGLRVSQLESIVQIDDQGTIDTDDDVTTDLEGTVLIEELTINAPSATRGIHLEDNDGLVSIAQLNVATANATALYALNTDQIIINDGSLTSTNAPAIDLNNSVVDIFLESVSVDGGPVGISMRQTTGRLFILGDRLTNSAQSGGHIQNTDLAVLLEDSGSFASQLLNYSGNKKVAEISDSEFFKLSQSHVTGTTEQFVNATNLRALEIDQSTFDGNTLTSQAGILYSVGDTGGYVVRVANNVVRETPQVFFNTVSTAGGEAASLNYIFEQNDIEMELASSVAARLNWAGSVNADLSNNLIIGNGINQKGFEIATGDSVDTSTFLLSLNRVGFTEANGTAIDLDTQGPAVASIAQNLIEFSGRDGVGIRVSATKTSSFNLVQNEIYDNAGGATGILFPTLHDGSTVIFNGNLIELSSFNAFVDRGIIISAVTGATDPIVTLESSLNNAISGASTTLSVPSNNITGRIIINGQVLQP